jgi:hypothetical protein
MPNIIDGIIHSPMWAIKRNINVENFAPRTSLDHRHKHMVASQRDVLGTLYGRDPDRISLRRIEARQRCLSSCGAGGG